MGFLRAGYPDGVPSTDYQPLLALLRRKLGDDEVHQVAAELIAEGLLPVTAADIGVAITKALDGMPSAQDVQRVKDRLAAGGWPVADAP